MLAHRFQLPLTAAVSAYGGHDEKRVYRRSIRWSSRGNIFGDHKSLHVRKRWLPVKAGRVSDADSEGGQENLGFWEGEEGRRKLDEIEEMRQLLQERKKLEEVLLKDEAGNGETTEEQARDRAERLSELLAQKAQEQVEKKKRAQDLFQFGIRAYGRGDYHQSVQILEAALSNVEVGSRLGGEIQVWLAMAYDANGQRAACITLYKRLENSHPLPAIRKQAYDLRYIAQAPKLKLSPDEILTVPILDRDNKSSTKTWSEMYREMKPRRPKKPSDSRDYMDDLMMWERPRWEKSPFFWVALTAWLILVAIALVFQD